MVAGVCFLLLHHRTRDDYPVVLLANRDEYFDRPFEAPAVRDADLGIVAPLDLRAGGTWLGTNRFGMVAAITNRGNASVGGVRSRGLLVDEVLRCGSAGGAVAWLERHLQATPYAGFNLLVADARHAWVIRHDGGEAPTRPAPEDTVALSPGAHALSNLHDLDEVPVPPLGQPPEREDPIETTLERLARLAQDDTTPLPRDHRILKRDVNRGTVCSALIALPAPDAADSPIFRFADGAPDQAPFLPIG